MRASIVRAVVQRGWRYSAALLGAFLFGVFPATRATAQSPVAAEVDEALNADDELFAELDAADAKASYPDPLEPANRVSLGFNEQLDRFVIDPISRGYAAIMPDQAEFAVRRVFRNLGEPISFLNHTLQLEPKLAGETLARFGMNTIGGVGGLIDIATPAGLPASHADFGGTLHHYGTPSGPYLVVPVLGPSTARDALGDAVDGVLSPQRYLLSGAGQIVIGTGDGITARSEYGHSLAVLRESSVDFYAALRTAYFLSRESELSGSTGAPGGPSATFRSSADTSASNPSLSSTAEYSARRNASSETVPPR
jgi:phospholipid-binding lipoprotein MlaA